MAINIKIYDCNSFMHVATLPHGALKECRLLMYDSHFSCKVLNRESSKKTLPNCTPGQSLSRCSMPRSITLCVSPTNAASHILGVNLSSDLRWYAHVDIIRAKVTQTFNFIRRNIYHCSHILPL